MARDVVIALVVGYLLGAVPAGLLLARAAKGVDIRQHGSGNIGATNVLRVVGVWAAALVLLYDVGKGVVAVLVARLVSDSPAAAAVAALAAVAGHTWPLWLRFQGGKGVATALGSIFILSPLVGGVALALGLSLIAITRLVSLGSLAGTLVALLVALALYATGGLPLAYLLAVAAAAPVIVARHWSNVGRLWRGTESRLGQRPHLSPTAKGPGG